MFSTAGFLGRPQCSQSVQIVVAQHCDPAILWMLLEHFTHRAERTIPAALDVEMHDLGVKDADVSAKSLNHAGVASFLRRTASWNIENHDTVESARPSAADLLAETFASGQPCAIVIDAKQTCARDRERNSNNRYSCVGRVVRDHVRRVLVRVIAKQQRQILR